MSFVSASFAGLFLVALCLRFLAWRRKELYISSLLFLSWLFYAWHLPQYLGLILFSTAVDYVAARMLGSTPKQQATKRKAILGVSLAVNLGLLGYFKYFTFLLRSARDLVHHFGVDSWNPIIPEILLPMGISFYTFQSLSYTIDVYRGNIPPDRSFMRVACYVSFFPQLVAGPIVRASDFLYQLDRKRPARLGAFLEGGYLIIRGFFLKVALADNLGLIVERHWDVTAESPQGFLNFSMIAFFSYQIFCDFAGYSDIARGLAYMLGFRLPINFNSPHIATTFADLWRRWHISISTWMRDYVYLPLGGSRKSYSRGTFNLVAVMLISGLWHGANWTFVMWGAIHAIAVMIERFTGVARRKRTVLGEVLGFIVVQFTWVYACGPFGSKDLEQAVDVCLNCFRGFAQMGQEYLGVGGHEYMQLVIVGWAFTAPIWIMHGRELLKVRFGVPRPSFTEKALYAGVMLAATFMLYTESQAFIYFQF